MRTILFISAIWCPACLIMRPRYQAFCANNATYELKEIDFDEEAAYIRQLNIGKTLPVAIVYEGAKEIMRIIGEISFKQVEEKLLSQ